jgi:hypothetical protein
MVGGGEIFYKKMIDKSSDIKFYYPSFNIELETPPANAVPIAVLVSFVDQQDLDIALALSGRHFDVVEIPDYSRTALLFLGAFHHFAGSADTFVLSLHGRMSWTIQCNQPPPPPEAVAFEASLESMVYRYAGVRYGISRAYIDELGAAEGRWAHYLPPYFFYDLTDFQPSLAVGDGLPALIFIGRYFESRKGPDLFVDLVGNIPRELYSEIVMVGPHAPSVLPQFAAMADHRGIDVRFAGHLSHEEVIDLYRRRSVLIVTSRREPLSLVTVEALLNGCPTVIADHLGVVRALDEDFPGIPHLRIRNGEAVVNAAAVADLLRNYDAERKALVDYLLVRRPSFAATSMSDLYSRPQDFDAATRAHIHTNVARILDDFQRHPTPIQATAPPKEDSGGRSITLGRTTGALPSRRSRDETAAIFQHWRGEAAKWLEIYLAVQAMPESTPADIDSKWYALATQSSQITLDRVRRTRELARLERLRQRKLIAAAYELRVMRWLGRDAFGALDGVEATLREEGFPEESLAARLMFSPSGNRDGEILAYLRSRRTMMLVPSTPNFVRCDDGRRDEGYRASVIVSLYNAADKLPRFLRALVCQTLFCAGGIEIILVDSASPMDEHGALIAALGADHPHVVYVRTSSRETIQCAWNRGIALARSPYLLFLGADEEMRPDAAAVLVDELDRYPAIDWVQGSAVVLNVDNAGVLVGDSGVNDRRWMDADAQYLDTTSLGHVVGIYRKTLHDRSGFYDPKFRAAGDTEFKNRAVPQMRARTLPLVLGRYVNYPENRMTAGCLAEIEDLRAWYLHRTPGGVRYGFGDRDPRDLERLLLSALQHHKCYRNNISSDADLAVLAADLLAEMAPDSAILPFRSGSRALLGGFRRLDWLLGDWAIEAARMVSADTLGEEISAVGQIVARIAHAHGHMRGLGIDDDYHFLNDNRCEQHSWAWP